MAIRAATKSTRKRETQSARATPAKRSYHKGNVADDLMAAAERILKTERVEEITVRRLTRDVGVTPANFYNHFPDLDDLLLKIAAKGFLQMAEASQKIRASASSRAHAARKSAVYTVEFALANRQLFRIMFGHIPNASAHTEYKIAADHGFSGVVELVYGDKRFDPYDLAGSHERGILAYAFWAMIYGLCRNIVENVVEFETGSLEEVTRFVERAVDAFIDGDARQVFQRPLKKG